MTKQKELFENKIEFIYLETIIGSGFEDTVAKLAIEDGIAYRAARKNMQIHSAILLKVNDEASGFFTFQNNHEIKEFCLLQSLDTVLRVNKNNPWLKAGIIKVKRGKFLGNKTLMSKYNPKTYFGKCSACYDTCGLNTSSEGYIYPRKLGILKQLTFEL